MLLQLVFFPAFSLACLPTTSASTDTGSETEPTSLNVARRSPRKSRLLFILAALWWATLILGAGVLVSVRDSLSSTILYFWSGMIAWCIAVPTLIYCLFRRSVTRVAPLVSDCALDVLIGWLMVLPAPFVFSPCDSKLPRLLITVITPPVRRSVTWSIVGVCLTAYLVGAISRNKSTRPSWIFASIVTAIAVPALAWCLALVNCDVSATLCPRQIGDCTWQVEQSVEVTFALVTCGVIAVLSMSLSHSTATVAVSKVVVMAATCTATILRSSTWASNDNMMWLSFSAAGAHLLICAASVAGWVGIYRDAKAKGRDVRAQLSDLLPYIIGSCVILLHLMANVANGVTLNLLSTGFLVATEEAAITAIAPPAVLCLLLTLMIVLSRFATVSLDSTVELSPVPEAAHYGVTEPDVPPRHDDGARADDDVISDIGAPLSDAGDERGHSPVSPTSMERCSANTTGDPKPSTEDAQSTSATERQTDDLLRIVNDVNAPKKPLKSLKDLLAQSEEQSHEPTIAVDAPAPHSEPVAESPSPQAVAESPSPPQGPSDSVNSMGGVWNACDDHEDPGLYRTGGYHPTAPGVTLNSRYSPLAKVGWGEFSVVWLALDLKANRHVAMKISKAAATYMDAARQEVIVMRKISEAALQKRNVEGVKAPVTLLVDNFECTSEFGRHCVAVLELCGPNLLKLVAAREFRGLNLNVVRTIVRKVAQGLDFLHDDVGFIHADLKPENVLLSLPAVAVMERLNASCECKAFPPELLARSQAALTGDVSTMNNEEIVRTFDVCVADLGTARPIPRRAASRRQGLKPLLIQTREYRAPEIILGVSEVDISPALDVWSLAAMSFELVTGSFLFDPKAYASHSMFSDARPFDMDSFHLSLMMQFLGPLPPPLLAKGSNTLSFFSRQQSRLHFTGVHLQRSSLGDYTWKYFSDRFSSRIECDRFVAFLIPMLQLDPVLRPSAAEVVQSPWLNLS